MSLTCTWIGLCLSLCLRFAKVYCLLQLPWARELRKHSSSRAGFYQVKGLPHNPEFNVHPMLHSRREADLPCNPHLSWWIQPRMLCLHLLTFASSRELQKQNKESLQRSLEQSQKQGMQRKQRHKDPDFMYLAVGELMDVCCLSFGNTFATHVLFCFLFCI